MSQDNGTTNSESAPRISLRMVLDELLAFVSMERGSLHTTLHLLKSPGASILNYVHGAVGARRRFTNPLRYLAMSVALVTLAYVFWLPSDSFSNDIEQSMSMTSSLEDPLSKESEEVLELRTQASDALEKLEELAEDNNLRLNAKEASAALQETIPSRIGRITLTWMNVFLLIGLPMNSLLTWILFRHAGFNLAEHFVINAYVLGFQNILALVLLPPTVLIDAATFTVVYMLLSILFQFIAWKQTFSLKGVPLNLLGVGMVLFSALAYMTLQGIITLLLLWVATLSS